MGEVWKPIKNYEGLYEISNIGRVRSLDRKITDKNGKIKYFKGKVLKARKNKNGYFIISLCKDGKYETLQISRLVASAFIPNPNNKPCVDHIDTNRENNEVSNLRWVTYKENNNNDLTRKHMSEGKKGQFKGNENPMKNPNVAKKISGENHYKATFTEEEVKNIREMYKNGLSVSEIIYKIYGINRKNNIKIYNTLHMNISNIVRYRTWKHIA